MPCLVQAGNEVLFYSLVVPVIPPSGNRVVRHTRNGRHYVPSEVTAFDAAIRLFARGKIFTDDSKMPLRVTIEVFLPKKKRGDADNFVKPTLDALVKCGIIKTDAQVRQCIVTKFRDPKEPRTAIGIEKCKPTPYTQREGRE